MNDSERFVLEECTRQYKTLTRLQIGALVFMFLLIPLGGLFLDLLDGVTLGMASVVITVPVAAGMLLWALTQKPNIRRRVAELGVDPTPWSAPIDRTIGSAGIIVVLTVCAILAFSLMRFLVYVGHGQQPDSPAPMSETESDSPAPDATQDTSYRNDPPPPNDPAPVDTQLPRATGN